jgi:hypothetical protein
MDEKKLIPEVSHYSVFLHVIHELAWAENNS